MPPSGNKKGGAKKSTPSKPTTTKSNKVTSAKNKSSPAGKGGKPITKKKKSAGGLPPRKKIAPSKRKGGLKIDSDDDEGTDDDFDFDYDSEEEDRLDDEAFADVEGGNYVKPDADRDGDDESDDDILAGKDLMDLAAGGGKKKNKKVAARVAERNANKVQAVVEEDDDDEGWEQVGADEEDEDLDDEDFLDAELLDDSEEDDDDEEEEEEYDDSFVPKTMADELALAKKRNASGNAKKRSTEEQTRDVIKKTVQGGGIGNGGLGDTFSIDPLSTSGLAIGTTPLLNDFANQRAEEVTNEDALLASAHKYFSELNRTEKKRNKDAMKKISEMKKVNKAGGDKDGFQFVLPTNTQKYVKQLASRDANDGMVIDTDHLESHFQGDGEADAKPMRRMKQRKHLKDDFYSFQVAQKWSREAKNHESFLARGRAHRDMFADRSKQRNANKL